MKRIAVLVACTLVCGAILAVNAAPRRLHLFLLSGQSNMAGLNPDWSFTPTLTNAFAGDEVIVVKVAYNGEPIRKWYNKWAPPNGPAPADNGHIYRELLTKTTAVLAGKPRPDSVTFVWMQGEADAHQGLGTVYEASLRGLRDQLSTDLKRADLNWVIGRISDFDMSNAKYPHWTMVRDIQVRVAASTPHTTWVDTDDLNGPQNALHYTHQGYVDLGQCFAAKAITLITGSQTKP